MSGIFSFIRDIFDDSREIRLLSDTRGYVSTGVEALTTSQLHLHLPEVRAPSQYLIDMGFQPTLAQQLSKTYMDFVARYRTACQRHFNRAIRGGCHLPIECYHDVFVVLFKRTTQAWGSQIVSIVRAQLRQAGAPQAIIRPERVDIRVDGVAKAEIIARLGLEATHLTSDRMVTNSNADVISRLEEVLAHPHALSADTVDSRLMMVTVTSTSSDVTSRVEGVSEKTHPLSIDTVDSGLMLSELTPILPTEVTSRLLDPFSQPAPPTCFPAPYPPPPKHSSYYSPQRALATSFVPPAPPRNLRPLTSYTPDVSSLTDLFGRMTVTTPKTYSTNPKCHRMFGVSEFNKIKPVPNPIAANSPKGPQLASIESITSPPKSTTTARRRKIAALPTRRSKTSTSPSPPVFDSAGTTSYPIPRRYERVVTEILPHHTPTSPQQPRLVSTLPPLYTTEVPYFAVPKSSTHRQKKVHTVRETRPQSQTIPQNQTSKPLATTGETFYNVSRSPPLVSDATSYFDSPPTSSDELDTPPSTPPSSHVLLASSSTESLTISSEPDRIVSYKGPLGDAKLPYSRQRYRRLNFTKGGLGRDEQPLTFTFCV